LQMSESPAQCFHVNRVVIRGNQPLRAEEEARGVTRPSIDLENLRAHVAVESLEYPAPESRCTTQALTSDHGVVVGCPSVDESELEDQPQGLDAVTPANVLAFGIGSAVVT